MATLDDILGNNNSSDNAPSAEKGTQQWSEENSGDNAPSVSQATPPVPAPESDSQPKPAQNQDPGAWVKWFIENNPYEKPKTPEEIEKEKKKHKRAQIFAAISDGISAISNLYFATQYAPNMFDGKNTLTGANQVRYDKLVKDRKENDTAYFNGMMRAMQADERKAEADRNWKRTLDLDKKNDERYQENIQHRDERERIEDERYTARVKQQQDNWQATFDEGVRRANQSHNVAVRNANNRAGGSGATKYYGNFDGTDYKTEADYNAAVISAATELGIPVTEELSDGTDSMLQPKTKVVRRPIAEVVADVAKKRKELEKQKQITMPGVKNGNTSSMPGASSGGAA